jgi:alkanesulfonate monooxygenase SsuD/methylene tetrahydromethanopterin reductase-like flavin-dependent oxidoreductase (luciferase family)
MTFAVVYHSAYHDVDPDRLIACARHAEDCGFESFFLPEHVVLHRGAVWGSAAVDPSLPFLDPLQALAFVAAATRRILLGTGVLQLPFHHPVTLAKRLATLDVLSRGRMSLLAVGLGAVPAIADPRDGRARARWGTSTGLPGQRRANLTVEAWPG